MNSNQQKALLRVIKGRDNTSLNFFINQILFGEDFFDHNQGLEESKLKDIRNILHNLYALEYGKVIEIIKSYGKVIKSTEKRNSNTTAYNPNVLKHNIGEESREKNEHEIVEAKVKKLFISQYLNTQSELFNNNEKKVMGFFVQHKSKYEETLIGEKLFYRTLEMIFLKIKIHHTILSKNS